MLNYKISVFGNSFSVLWYFLNMKNDHTTGFNNLTVSKITAALKQ